jgi:glycosyltransferase involved in cell wall biosynthesis
MTDDERGTSHLERMAQPNGRRWDASNEAPRMPRLALVTPFPHAALPVHGVADYAKHLASALNREGMDVEVWADRLTAADSRDGTSDQSPPVLRNWRPGVLVGADLWRALRFRRPEIVHVQIEPFIYGGLIGLASLQFFLLAVRLAGIPLFVTLHHVAAGKHLSRAVLRQIGVRLPPSAAKTLQRISMRFLGSVANRLIVHADLFKERLAAESGLDPARIDVIPHGVPHARGRPRAGGPPTLLMFGYVKWYKGVDIVLRAFELISSDFPAARLVIAGGLPFGAGPHHPHRQFIDRVHHLGAPLGQRVNFLGYVSDEMVPELYDAATVVLFPYRLLFGASGPLSLAVGYRKPFIVSRVLSPLVPFWPLATDNSPEQWADAIRRALRSADLQESAEEILEPVASLRHWSHVAAATIASYRIADAMPRATFDMP